MTVFSSPLSGPLGALVSDFIGSLDTADGAIMVLRNMELRQACGQQCVPAIVTSLNILTCKPGQRACSRT